MAMLAVFCVWTHSFDSERHADEIHMLEDLGFAFKRSVSPQEPWRKSSYVLQYEEVWKEFAALEDLLGCLRTIGFPCILTFTEPSSQSEGMWRVQIRNRADTAGW
jgi:hypothetical protein